MRRGAYSSDRKDEVGFEPNVFKRKTRRPPKSAGNWVTKPPVKGKFRWLVR